MMITEHINISLKNPVIGGHIVYGQAILPGLAYIDLIYQVFRKHNYDYTTLELRDLTIHYPMAVNDGEELQLSVSCNAGREGKWQIVIEGSTIQQGTASVKRKFVTAEMHPPAAPIADEVLDLAAIRHSAKEIISMEDIYRRAREVELVHTGFVKSEGAVYHTEEAAFIDISVAQEAIASAAGFMFHPALIDGSAMGTGLFPVEENGKPFLFLPLFYESFYATALLQEACIARYSASRKKDLLYLNITFFNKEGRKVARLKNFSNKLVKEPGQINPERTAVAPVEQVKEIAVAAPVVPNGNNETFLQVVNYLQQLMAAATGRPAGQIDIKSGYYELGLTSASLLSIVETIGEKIGAGLSPILLFEHTTVAELAGYLSGSYPQAFGGTAQAIPLMNGEENRLPVNVNSMPAGHDLLPETADVAIIGIAGRYPGAENIAAFWENLLEGKDCITEVPPERWNWRRHEELRSPSGKILSRWGGFLKDVDRFDPAFFKISPRDAETMDPQERLFLETCWETMEDAGYTPKSLAASDKRNKVGVFVGVMHKDYALIGAEAVLKGGQFPLSLNYAQIANRVSYCCNFHGPSMAVDTVCSSSLTAMHLALDSIRHGESEVALAGGVNLSLHPDKYLSYGLMDLHASDGYCHAFGKGGDGYVSGECVAAVLLKPLHKAVQDHDHIYAVIKGSSINHGGTASGITVPSPVAQADMIVSCLEKTGIHPRTISYVEAHGTGTSLGDPIEIQGLVKAYRQYTADKQYCSIGSVKSNIGHAEAAAGISGLSKAVMQLYHKTLAPSLHSQELNPYIDFASSPFYVQREKAVWHAPEIITGEGTKVLPRRAAVSSFGATGANAHVILEEYTPASATVITPPVQGRQYLVPLSAKNRERLLAYAARLLQRLRENPATINPADLAFTLQTGRVTLEQRIAFVVEDIPGLIEKLQAFVNGQTDIPGSFEGLVKANQDTLQLFSGDEDWGMLVKQWLQKGQLKKAAELWVKGQEIDWSLLYTSGRPQRISLPAYPFARERYWIPENEQPLPAGQQQTAALLHPLVHRNTSDFTEQRFSSTFSGNEFFLADHVVQGRRILPGVAYLEMARAAATYAMRTTNGEETIQFRNIVWAAPLMSDKTPVIAHVGLYPEANGEISYEVYADAATEKSIYSKGSILFAARQDRSAYNIADLQHACNRRRIPGKECYRVFNDMGIAYGPAFQGISEIYAGTGQLLAKIIMPATVDTNRFVLHPSILDAAMQTTLMLRYHDGNTRPAMAFALRSCSVLQPCNSEMWAYTRYSEDGNDGNTLQRFDIDLCDEQGNICVEITGLSSKAAGTEPAADPASRAWHLVPVWDPIVAEPGELPRHDTVLVAGATNADMTAIRAYYPQAKTIDIAVTDSTTVLQGKLENAAPFDHIIWLTAATGNDDLRRQEKEVLQGFRFIRALLHCQPESALQYFTVVTRQGAAVSLGETVCPASAGIHGLVGALAKECPRWKIRLADMPATIDLPWKDILTLAPDIAGNAKAFRNGQWYYQQMLPLEGQAAATTPVYRRRGVYVVIGGAGAVGTAWTEYMIRRYDAQIIWIGRRAKDETIQAGINAMALLGTAPEYISADAGDKDAMLQAYQSIKSKYSQVNGVVHSAMVLHARNIKSMEEADFIRVSSAKVAAGISIAEVFEQEPLDFIVFFSSIVSFVKNAGQSGYAAGSLFADALSRQLSRRASCAVKTINWGYWGSVGVVADSEVLKDWTRKNELGLISSAEAWEVLENLLASPLEQLFFHKTTGPAGMNALTLSDGALRLLPQPAAPCLERISARPLPERVAVPVVPVHAADMTAALCEVIWVLMRETGLFGKKHFTLTDITPVVIPTYHRWLEESLEILAANGYLSLKDDTYTVLQEVVLSTADAWGRWEAKLKQWQLESSEKEWIRLAEVMLHALPQILTGKYAATDIMFHDASLDLVRGIYRGNEVADYFNEVLAQAVVAYLRDRSQQGNNTPVRILEIGAGTGATSTSVFRLINEYAGQIGEYCFTDISKAFLFAGESVYGKEYPGLPITYKLLDISQSPVPQGFEPGSYDMVIAANVLHATKNITQTLRNTKSLLSKHGLLLLNEVSSRLFFAHLTFGLLKGWWLTEDPWLRIQGCPGLYPHSWKSLLQQEGLGQVWFPAQAAHVTGQQIIVAESDGMVRTAEKKTVAVIQPPVKHIAAPVPTAVLDDNTDKEELIRKTIIEKLSVSLKIAPDKIDSDASFADFGLDSIIGLHAVQLLNEGMHLSLESTVLFDYSSVNRLAAYIHANHQPVLEKAVVAAPPVQPQQTTPAITFQRRLLPVPEKSPLEEKGHKDPVAIVGMSGKFAGADNVHQLWDYLRSGADLVEKVTRWDLSAYYEAGESYCDQGSFIRDIAAFDPLFFNISGLEATYIDPQQRLFLEEAWKALEDAGYAGGGVAAQPRLWGVYAGSNAGDYQQLFKDKKDIPPQAFWGNLNSITPARIAYHLDLQGPAIAVDTACSSSLVAIHLACQGLWERDTDMALAGGVFVQSTPTALLDANRAGMLSPGGRCFTFDNRADGFVLGEGVGVVVLKRLKDALKDGDHIYGLISGSGINQDGTTNGITAPSAVSQERLESRIYEEFNIDAADIQMVETHGTGTKLGDPIEFNALTRSFRKHTDRQAYCAIGSIKTNIGHVTAAAGVAGLVKVLLSMQHKMIPASLHFESANTNIAFGGSPFYVNTALKNWDTPDHKPRRAALSSFGLSGTNAHMVIEEAPLQKRVHTQLPGYMIVLSAHSAAQLRQQVTQLLDYCRQSSNADLGDMSYTLLLGRKHFPHRWAAVSSDLNELIIQLEKWLDTGNAPQVWSGVLPETGRREDAAQKKQGEDCIQRCAQALPLQEYSAQMAVIAGLYIQGYTLAFDRLFTTGYGRVPLPAYPFARDSYWVETTTVSTPRVVTEMNIRMMTPVWEKMTALPAATITTPARLLLIGGEMEDKYALQQYWPGTQLLHINTINNINEIVLPAPGDTDQTHVVWIAPDHAGESTDLIAAQDAGVLSCFRLIKVLLQKGYATHELSWTIITRACVSTGPRDSIRPDHAALHGLCGAMAKEFPHWSVKLADLPEGTPVPWEQVMRLPADVAGNALAWREGSWYSQHLALLEKASPAASPYRRNGVYVVIGGAGGIGTEWSEYMIRNWQAQVIWIGRRREDADILARRERLGALGVMPDYIQADATDAAALRAAHATIVSRYGRIHGVIQSAIVLQDQSLLNMEESVFHAALRAKVDISVHMAQVFGQDKPDFVLFFSAMNAFIKAPGQSNYAAGSTFEDAYARYLSQQWNCAVKTINWGYWGHAGIVSGASYRRRMDEAGIGSITSAEAMAALEQLLAGNIDQIALIKATPAYIIPGIQVKGTVIPVHTLQLSEKDTRKQTAQPAMSTQTLKNHARSIIRSCISHLLRIAEEQIRDDHSFSALGVDSIIAVQLVARISKETGCRLQAGVLFDYSNVAELAQHMAEAFKQELEAALQPQHSPLTEVKATNVPALSVSNTQSPQASPSPVTAIHKEPIAIIGMSGRYPGSASLEELWAHLSNGDDLVTRADRWSATDNSAYDGGFLDNIDQFDPHCFNITALEASYMDPQQRLFLEESWKALENAGYTGNDGHTHACGVYVGCHAGDYQQLLDKDAPPQAFWGNAHAVIPARIAYHLNLQGPAMAIDTACSSSLVAIQQACQSLWTGEVKMALAGGVFVQVTPRFYELGGKAGMLSPTGRCYSFDERADGFIPGEGAGAVVLKKLSDAIADGDHIYGVIKGTAANQDGATNGITAPSGRSQERLICQVYENFNIHPENIGMVEAHGTATKLGDPIEYSALTNAFRKYTNRERYCALGTIKTNIGHASAAAGIAGLSKILLSLQHNQIPPSLHYRQGNSSIAFEGSPFFVNTGLQDWHTAPGQLRQAALSAFGFSGTNVHMVIEEAPQSLRQPVAQPAYLIALSARTQVQLHMQVRQLLMFSEANPQTAMGDISYTLLLGRKHFHHRLSLVAGNDKEMRELLRTWLENGSAPGVHTAVLQEGRYEEQDALMKYGEECITVCRQTPHAAEYRERLSAIASLYVNGYALPFDHLLANGRYGRIPLPGYSFLRERYWVPEQKQTAITSPAVQHPAVTPADITGSLQAATETAIQQLLASITGIAADRLDVTGHFEELGLDSIMITHFSKGIEKWTGHPDTTLFFRYHTIRSLAKHLADTYPAAMKVHDNTRVPAQPAMDSRPAAKPAAAPRPEQHANVNEHTDIAIIGIAGRYPQAETLEQFWNNLYEGKDCIEEVPADRWSLEGFYEPDFNKALEEGRSYIKWGGFLKQVDCFDPLFFGISPRNAILMDPQERLFLETAWACLEDAGYTRSSLEQEGYGNRIGVFAGATFNNYQLLMAEAAQQQGKAMYIANSQIYSIANRVSYVMNFTGPSLTVDTACSSSLQALHLACESIRRGESRMALAGGVNLSLHYSKYITLSQEQFGATDGHCRAFGEGGSGYVPAEGVGVVFLKPLQDAITDGDHIYGVIKGTAASHAGKTNGYTVPAPASQSLAIETALRNSNIDARSISCIEAHGTGTSLGDPIELAGLTDVFRKYTSETGFCAISSVKSNIGHAEAAAGIAQLTKVLLQLKHQTLVSNLMHGQRLNPNIAFEQTPFVVQQHNAIWKRPVLDGREMPRRAGISSFGAGGANVHVIVEEYISGTAPAADFVQPSPYLIVLSAKNEDRLRMKATQLLDAVRSGGLQESQLPGIVYTLQTGREAMEVRLAFSVSSMNDLEEKLTNYLAGTADDSLLKGAAKDHKEALALFGKAEDLQELLDFHAVKKQYHKLLELWVKGAAYDWNRLYAAGKPVRISLPVYPFAKERCWVGGNKVVKTTPVESPVADPSAELMTFEEYWEPTALTINNTSQFKICVCMLGAAGQPQPAVAARPGTTLVFITPGSRYEKSSPHHYTINANDRSTYEQAFRDIASTLGRIDAVLYGWALADHAFVPDCTPIVLLLQALAATGMKQVRCLLTGSYRTGVERCYLESWTGIAHSLGMTLPGIKMGIAFYEAGGISLPEWMQYCFDELQADKIQSTYYRAGQRYVSRIRPVTPEEPTAMPIRAGGTYLITGGAGGLGLIFARHLAATQRVNLILTGRKPLDASRNAAINALEALGGKVWYVQADLCDEAAMNRGLQEALQHCGPVNGVIHAAGIASDKSILEKSAEGFRQVLAPKVTGTIVLDQLLKEQSPDFVCYFSSSSGILGDFGAGDYAMANRFLMAYARYRNEVRMPGKTLVINWPLWKEGGMQFDADDITRMYLKSSGQRLLETSEGIAVFMELLAQPRMQHLVITGQRDRVHRFLGLETAAAVSSLPPATPVTSTVPVNILPAKNGLPTEEAIEQDLKTIVGQLLEIAAEKLDHRENLADLGFDSVRLTAFANRINAHYGIEITPALFFGHPTIEKLTTHFLTAYTGVVTAFYAQQAVQADVASDKENTINKQEDTNTVPGVLLPVAITGMSGRFPQARNIDEMWDILEKGDCAVEEIPAERFDWRKYHGDPAEDPEKTNCRWSGFIPGVKEFDPAFFEISPREAAEMDPRQRLLMQEAWRALEDAGYGPAQLKAGKVGMFVGVEEGDYQLLPDAGHHVTANHTAILASRLAYFLDLKGPVMAINTACSSALAALHQACTSLRNRECDAAVVAAVNLMLLPERFVYMSQAGMLSADGKCAAFSKHANGMVPGEAVAAIVLKRLPDAEEQGDPIYAVISASGINYDGKTNGITAPGSTAQAELLNETYERFNIHPEDIDYIVTHGTGTRLGDPVEIDALHEVFKKATTKKHYCALTSSKSNFGHTLAASGLVSLINLVQALRHKTIPASLHCEEESDYVKWSDSPFYINKAARPWDDRGKLTLTGAVSAFGFSGTNAHVVVQRYQQEVRPVHGTAPYYLLPLSAATEEALQEKISDMLRFLLQPAAAPLQLAEISYTLMAARQHFAHRCMIIASSKEEAIALWRQAERKEQTAQVHKGIVSAGFREQKVQQQYLQGVLETARSLENSMNGYTEILHAVADSYCQGYLIDWPTLYGDKLPLRIHLPAYPFAREHYWWPKKKEQAALPVVTLEQEPPATATLVYEQLLDEVLNNDITIDMALQRIKEM